MNRGSRLSLCLLSSLCLWGESPAADWPQWRGPDRTGVSSETGLLAAWPKGGPKLLWTYEQAGNGYSGPSIVGGRLYSAGAETDDEKEFVFCVDVASGKEVWRTPIARKSNATRVTTNWGGGPRGSPTVDGDALYVIGFKGDLACVGLDGKVRWQKSLVADFNGKVMAQWGWCESPLIDGDKLICCPGYEDGTVAALDKTTGAVLWRSAAFTDNASYSSVVAATLGGVRQYVVKSDKHTAGIAAADGALLWKHALGVNSIGTIPTCVVQDNLVFSTCGYIGRGGDCGVVEVAGGGGSKLSSKVLYRNLKLGNHHGGVVAIGEHLYGHAEPSKENGNKGGWTCMAFKTGEVAWKSDKLDKGSCTAVGDRLICWGEKTANVVLVDASPKGWAEHGRFSPPKQSDQRKPAGGFWTHPVVAGGRLYLRDQELLFCYDLRAGATAE